MTTLVTGASGFIGGELARVLTTRGEKVRILARSTSNLRALADLDLEIVRGDLADRLALSSATAGVSTIYHCGGLSSDWAPWSEFEQANVIGVANLLDATLAAGTVDRFVHVSTTDVYGYPKKVGDETTPMKDVGYPYNRSKIMGERLVQQCHRETGMPTTVVRPATVFGERSPTFTVEFARYLLAGELPYIAQGRSHAGLIYVGDLIEAMMTAASEPEAIGQVYNLRDPAATTWREAIDTFAEGLGVTKEPRNVPRPVAVAAAHMLEATYKLFRRKNRPLLTRHVVDIMTRDQGYPIKKAQRELGFAPKVGVDEGLRRSVDWLHSAEGEAALGG